MLCRLPPATAARTSAMLRALKGRWYTANALAMRLQCDRVTAALYCEQFAQDGLLATRSTGPHVEYTVAHGWGGVAVGQERCA